MAVLFALPACKDDAFFCTSDEQCTEGGAAGICQANELCSFPDDDCPSGQAYGKYSGALAGRCVAEEDVASTGPDVPTSTEPSPPTSSTSTSSTPGETSAGETTSTGPDDDSTSGSSTTSEAGSADPGLPDGSTCQENDDCASSFCYDAILGSVCGECLSDADCEHGCTPPYPLDPSELWSQCNDGELGDSCQTSEACSSPELQCVSFANVAGILSISTCSECATTEDCPGSMLCNEFFNAGEFRGAFACVNPGSVFDGSFCTIGSVGEAACINHCAPGNYKGLFNFGVCGECSSDAHCSDGESCVLPELDLEAGTASTPYCG